LELLIACAALIAGLPVALLAGPQAPAARPAPEPWGQAWRDLGRLEESVPGSPQFERIRRELESFVEREDHGAKKSRDAGAAYRAQILRAQIARLRGAPFKPVSQPASELPLFSGEAWLVLQVAAPGPMRVRALSASLAESAKADLPPRVERGIEAAEEDARNLKLDWAVAEARALHASAADRRTARLLARILRLRGESAAAAELLDATLRDAPEAADRAALHDDLAEVRLASGDEDAALKELGAALALGSNRAAERLAARALSEGRIDRARALYRSLQEDAFRVHGAARGYGLALLAVPRAVPGLAAPEAAGVLARNPPQSPH
jgi:tetratricopeptide (TPR) repeat protein